MSSLCLAPATLVKCRRGLMPLISTNAGGKSLAGRSVAAFPGGCVHGVGSGAGGERRHAAPEGFGVLAPLLPGLLHRYVKG